MQAEVELKAQIDALLARASATNETEAAEPELDLHTEIDRRAAHLKAICESHVRIEPRQHVIDLEPGRVEDERCWPRLCENASLNPRGAEATRQIASGSTIATSPRV